MRLDTSVVHAINDEDSLSDLAKVQTKFVGCTLHLHDVLKCKAQLDTANSFFTPQLHFAYTAFSFAKRSFARITRFLLVQAGVQNLVL